MSITVDRIREYERSVNGKADWFTKPRNIKAQQMSRKITVIKDLEKIYFIGLDASNRHRFGFRQDVGQVTRIHTRGDRAAYFMLSRAAGEPEMRVSFLHKVRGEIGRYFTSEHSAQIFNQLKNRWIEETRFTSSISEVIENDNYRKIIDLGWVSLVYIFRDLEKENRLWFWALESITGINPISEEEEGDNKRIRLKWLEWARKRGII